MASQFKGIIVLLTIVLHGSILLGQNKIYFGTDYFLSKNYSDDIGIFLGYSIPHSERNFMMEVEYRTVNWGNLIEGGLGYSVPVYWTSNLSVNFIPRANFGWSLFRPKSLFTYGGSLMGTVRWQSRSAFGIETGVGYSYLICPKYSSAYLNNQTDFPVRLSLSWKL